MKQVCCICGLEAEEHWMFSYNTGRKRVWLCWDCYKQSQYEATKSDMVRQKKLYQIRESKKRHK